MSARLASQPLTAQNFAPFGEVLEVDGAPDKLINQGQCGRYHDLAQLDFSDGRAGLSLFNSNPRQFPILLDMMERHPDGSQAFIPMTQHPFVVVVAADVDGVPGQPHAFVTKPGQGVNYRKNTWHGVLTPLHAPGLFAVVDRIGSGVNLEEHWFTSPYHIEN